MPFKEVFLLAVGVALCLGSALPALPEVSAELVEGHVSSRYGEYNKYYLYNSDHYRNPVPLILGNISDSAFNTRRTQTVVIVHGHEGNRDSQLNRDLINALLTRSERSNGQFEVDIIVVDWEIISSVAYSYSPLIVPSIASHIVTLIRQLMTANVVNLHQLHLVGFDLGAHVVGFVGRALGNVARITALDPTREAWGAGSESVRDSDANYVEVIHTDAFGTNPLGIADAIGHVDIYLNGGTNQPGCANNHQCNHNRAWAVFAATVLIHDRILNANGCASITDVTSNRCVDPPVEVGGVSTRKFASGLYRGTTTTAHPFF